jgi:hypothetical protein
MKERLRRLKFAIWCRWRHNWRGSPYASGGWQRPFCWACEDLPPTPEMKASRQADLARLRQRDSHE